MATELEIKYAVGDLQLLDCMLCDPMIREKMQTGAFRNIRMETTYYDTQDGAFSARKWTYRLRRENERSVITLKTPGSGYERGEWEWEGEYLDEAELTIVCGASFTRIAADLTLEGAQCELCGDIGWLTGGGRREPLCELELELKGGSAEAMLAFARKLAGKYGLREEQRSKFARARALAAAR